MKRLFISIVAFSAATSTLAAPIHDHVAKLDFASVKSYISQGGDINLVDDVSGKTPLALAINQALPKSFELKNYPFDKRTFMFIKKFVNCGLTTGVKKVTQHMVFDNPQGNVLVDGLTGNDAASSATCNEAGECKAEKAGEETSEPSCVTQEEIGAFLSQVRSDAPNCITSVTDILAAANDYLFENILFYEGTGQESAELNMIKLLISNKAKIADGTALLIKKTVKAVDQGSELAARQSFIRAAGDVGVFLASSLAQAAFINPRAQGAVRYPINAGLYMLGVKTVMDVRNFVAAWVHLNTAKKASEQLHEAIFTPVEK